MNLSTLFVLPGATKKLAGLCQKIYFHSMWQYLFPKESRTTAQSLLPKILNRGGGRCRCEISSSLKHSYNLSLMNSGIAILEFPCAKQRNNELME